MTSRTVRRLWLASTPGRITDAIYGPHIQPPRRQRVTYLPPGHELTAANLERYGVDLPLATVGEELR